MASRFEGKDLDKCKHEPMVYLQCAASLWTRGIQRSERRSGQACHAHHVATEKRRPQSDSLVLDTGAGSDRIATVKGGQLVGVGTVSLRTEQSGGRFDIKGKDASGATIEGSITCPSFGNIVGGGRLSSCAMPSNTSRGES